VSTDLKMLMREHKMVGEIVNDPDLTADAKLFAVCVVVIMAEWRDLSSAQQKLQKRRDGGWLVRASKMAGRRPYWTKMVIAADVPRYEADYGTGTCVGVMIRREGLCGKRTHRFLTVVDPSTGAKEMRGYCTRHWSQDYADDQKRQFAEWKSNGEPTPAPNQGGTLKKYLHTDWPKLYAWAAPYRTPLDGAKPATVPRPKLTLVVNEALR